MGTGRSFGWPFASAANGGTTKAIRLIAFVRRTRKVCSPGRGRLCSSSEPVMPLAASQMSAGHDIVATLGDAVSAVESLFGDARRAVGERVALEGRVISRAFDREQRATHGLAWLATYVEALRQLTAYARRLADIGAGEYLAQIVGGIPMSQGEIVRLSDLGLPAAVAARITPAVEHLIATGN